MQQLSGSSLALGAWRHGGMGMGMQGASDPGRVSDHNRNNVSPPSASSRSQSPSFSGTLQASFRDNLHLQQSPLCRAFILDPPPAVPASSSSAITTGSMFSHQVAVVALSALALVSAGNSTFSINPSAVPLSTRAAWCTSETNVCTAVCNNSPSEISCDPATLDYECSCNDGTTPDMNEYKESLPFHICQEAFTECITQTVGNAAGQRNCTTSISDKCGTKNATDSSASTPSTTTAASSSGTATAASSSKAATSSTSKAGAMPTNIQHIGNGAAAVAVGLLAYML
ncbi:hypothetical protein JX265_007832 [Neoarthrinium moseri]|uniref:DUF7707 domain-containing protein n=2 Tax=Neoarthrinium moseri TaxID=1658444 RepID=A0A9P9WJE8_9PEZI|nr:hypothetical protein JX265_007832 [Neoarthrinium moseri]